MPVTHGEQLPLVRRAPHVVQESAVRIDALPHEVQVLLHLVHVVVLGEAGKPVAR